MTKIKCIILDDEPLAVELLKKHASENENLIVSLATTEVFEAIDFLKNNRILFNMEDSKKYFVKIEISSKKLKYILNNFKDIEIVDMNKYYI